MVSIGNDEPTGSYTKVSSLECSESLSGSLPILVIGTPEPLSCPHSGSSASSRLSTSLLSTWITPPSAESLLLIASVLPAIAHKLRVSNALLALLNPVLVGFFDPLEWEVL